MSAINAQKARVVGAIGAIQTLLEKYPFLVSTDTTVPGETSLSFMLNILDIIGVKKKDIIEWVAKLLAGKGADGFLVSVEWAIKAILLANVKNLLTCSMNPMLPDKLMYKYKDVAGKDVMGSGIMLDLNKIDLYGVLGNSPKDKNGGGSMFYFDAEESIYSTEEHPVNGYSTNELWKSCDFNAYLWYVIHKGTNVGAEARKLYWDNRVKYIERFKDPDKGETYRNSFFDINKTDGKFYEAGSGEAVTFNKKQILITEYIERSESNLTPNVIRIWLNDERYYHKRNLKLKSVNVAGFNTPSVGFKLNKTVFEFNYDYIMSLKLFDSKTLVANIINAILGISASINLSYSIYENVIAAKIGSIVRNVIRSNDTEIDDCFFTFSNDEYDSMLQESIKKHNKIYAYNNNEVELDYSKIIDSVNEISNAATLQEQVKSISNVFDEILATPAQMGEVEAKDKFAFGLDIIQNILEETITQLVMQILSPKVVILYQINQAIMGDIDPQGEFWKDVAKMDIESFLKSLKNVIIQAILEIESMILKQLLAWLLEKLKPLLALFVSKLLLETLNDYMTLLKQLISFCGMGWSSGVGNKSVIAIDNVDYADIVPSKLTPNNDEC